MELSASRRSGDFTVAGRSQRQPKRLIWWSGDALSASVRLAGIVINMHNGQMARGLAWSIRCVLSSRHADVAVSRIALFANQQHGG